MKFMETFFLCVARKTAKKKLKAEEPRRKRKIFIVFSSDANKSCGEQARNILSERIFFI